MDPDAPAFCPAGTAAALQHTVSGWHDAWSMPLQLPQVLSGLQGMWCDSFGCSYLVQNDCCHVTLRQQHYTVVPLAHDGRAVWWLQRWYVDEEVCRSSS